MAIKLNAQSDFGEKILEPYCDFILSISAVGGLVLTQNISWALVIGLAIIAIAAHTGEIAISKLRLLNRFCCGFMPFYYLFVILIATAIYAAKAFGIYALWLLIPAALLGIYAIKAKQHRLRAWLRGQP